MVEVEIDNATGLPLQSYWARKKPTALTRNQDPMIVDTNAKTTWTVEYRAWQFFEAIQGERRRVLMPTHLVITRRKPYARFEIKARESTPVFSVNPEVSATRARV
ncbi:MAG: hypothetical protein IID46_05625 [Planctomycetes bacterium]|nr:hypothetical protein [Planctomycetota bacterium]